jgi:hypothetical protein
MVVSGLPANIEEEEEGVTKATQAATLQLNPASEGTQPEREGGRSDKPQMPANMPTYQDTGNNHPAHTPQCMCVSIGLDMCAVQAMLASIPV